MYSPDILKHRISIHLPGTITDGNYGREATAGTTITRWAAVDWSRGAKALMEGAVEAYDTIMVRMNYDAQITRHCQVTYDGERYQIKSFHRDYQEGTIQMTCQELSKG